MIMTQAIVIGGGAAGLMAAAACAARGKDTVVIEKMPVCAKKVSITGKGRCNVTNACFEISDLISNVPRNPRFLYSAFSSFMPYDTMSFFEELGVPLKIERGNRVFPQSDNAKDISSALVRNAKNNGVKFIHAAAKSFKTENGRIKSVVLSDGSEIECESVALCTGGKSYPATGSTGDGYALAKSVGHTVTEISPALVSLKSDDTFIPELQGLSLKNISIKLIKNDKTVYSDFGEMLFTHYGISGPVILSASSHIEHPKNGGYSVVIDLKPALDSDTLDKRIQRDFDEFKNKDVINSLSKLLPRKLIPVIIDLWGIPQHKKVNEITRVERRALVHILKNLEVSVSGFYTLDSAIITRGGINVKEIDPRTMRSKIIDNLFFAGEIIDVDAYTGGFNLQIAFSTGRLCGENM